MLEILADRRAHLEQQKADLAMAEMEMDNAEARCREALAEVQKKKETHSQGTKQHEDTAT